MLLSQLPTMTVFSSGLSWQEDNANSQTLDARNCFFSIMFSI